MEIRRDVFQAIADPTRRKIIGMLAANPRNLNAISENFDVSRQAISLHIKILAESGLILIRQQGRERFCSIKPKKLAEVDDWLAPFRTMWEGHFDRLGVVLEKMDKKKRKPTQK